MTTAGENDESESEFELAKRYCFIHQHDGHSLFHCPQKAAMRRDRAAAAAASAAAPQEVRIRSDLFGASPGGDISSPSDNNRNLVESTPPSSLSSDEPATLTRRIRSDAAPEETPTILRLPIPVPVTNPDGDFLPRKSRHALLKNPRRSASGSSSVSHHARSRSRSRSPLQRRNPDQRRSSTTSSRSSRCSPERRRSSPENRWNRRSPDRRRHGSGSPDLRRKIAHLRRRSSSPMNRDHRRRGANSRSPLITRGPGSRTPPRAYGRRKSNSPSTSKSPDRRRHGSGSPDLRRKIAHSRRRSSSPTNRDDRRRRADSRSPLITRGPGSRTPPRAYGRRRSNSPSTSRRIPAVSRRPTRSPQRRSASLPRRKRSPVGPRTPPLPSPPPPPRSKRPPASPSPSPPRSKVARQRSPSPPVVVIPPQRRFRPSSGDKFRDDMTKYFFSPLPSSSLTGEVKLPVDTFSVPPPNVPMLTPSPTGTSSPSQEIITRRPRKLQEFISKVVKVSTVDSA